MSDKRENDLEPIKSDALDALTIEALLHTLPDHWKLDWWVKQLSIFVPTHKLVKREDLEELLFGYTNYAHTEPIDEGDIEYYKRIKEEYDLK